jgi:hypothetical protein
MHAFRKMTFARYTTLLACRSVNHLNSLNSGNCTGQTVCSCAHMARVHSATLHAISPL